MEPLLPNWGGMYHLLMKWHWWGFRCLWLTFEVMDFSCNLFSHIIKKIPCYFYFIIIAKFLLTLGRFHFSISDFMLISLFLTFFFLFVSKQIYYSAERLIKTLFILAFLFTLCRFCLSWLLPFVSGLLNFFSRWPAFMGYVLSELSSLEALLSNFLFFFIWVKWF